MNKEKRVWVVEIVFGGKPIFTNKFNADDITIAITKAMEEIRTTEKFKYENSDIHSITAKELIGYYNVK